MLPSTWLKDFSSFYVDILYGQLAMKEAKIHIPIHFLIETQNETEQCDIFLPTLGASTVFVFSMY